ncbi:MAG: hypothetical protein AB2L11_00160 [Syntrophobacteraceae bacterium]
MKSRKNVIQFPTLAEPSIEDILGKFLTNQEKRLKPRTYHRYEEVIDLLKHCLNSYGHNELENASDAALYEKFYLNRNYDFCAIFGPDKILPSLSHFLNYFMIRKVMASEALLQAAGTVTKRLVKWLEESGHIDREQCLTATDMATEAAKELPAAERLARLLYEHAQTHAPRYWTTELDDYFIIEKIEPGVLFLSGMGMMEQVELHLPREITDHCRLGWQINLLLGKTRNGWGIIETGNVYPS